MQVVVPHGINLGQRAGQEVGLLLVVAFEHNAVVRRTERFEQCRDVASRHDTTLRDRG